MKGILLAGGTASRLRPATSVVSKHMLPVYDKPMVYYPLSLLMLAGIREILLISTPQHLPCFQSLLGNGSHFGIRLKYAAQPEPRGVAEAFILAEDFIGTGCCALVLGDNILHGPNLQRMLLDAAGIDKPGAVIFALRVKNPSQYGVVCFDRRGRAIDLQEKPLSTISFYAVPGLYFYGPGVSQIARTLSPSSRGELEVTDLNRAYIHRAQCRVRRLGRRFAWFDAGTPGELLQAASFVAKMQDRRQVCVACLEEIGLQNGWMTREALARRASMMAHSEYGDHLRRISSPTARRKDG